MTKTMHEAMKLEFHVQWIVICSLSDGSSSPVEHLSVSEYVTLK